MIDTTKLRELAQNATPGEWYVSAPAEHAVWKDIGDRRYLIADTSDGFTDDNNSEYIAAANPATVLALLDDLDSAKRALAMAGYTKIEGAEEWKPPIGPSASPLLDELDRTRSTVDIVSSALFDAEKKVAKLYAIEAAARNLAKVKGRHNSEQAMNQLLEALK